MKKTIFTIGILYLFYSITLAQSNLPFDIEGKWKVVGLDIQAPTPSTKEIEKQIVVFKEMFLHSVFIFQTDHKFNFDIAIDELKVQKGHWKYNTNNYRYQIQEWADKDKNNSFLMEIELKREGDKTFFVMPTDNDMPKEFSFKLEVVKIIE